MSINGVGNLFTTSRMGGYKPLTTAQDIISKKDQNGDGVIGVDEANDRLANNFQKVDSDGDGLVNRQELEEGLNVLRAQGMAMLGHQMEQTKAPISAERLIENADGDGDGSISRDEAKGPLALHFDKADTDGNGFVSQEELQQGLNGIQAMRANMRAQLGSRINHLQNLPNISDPTSATEIISNIDQNGDNSISLDEAKGVLVKQFNEIDTDGDQMVSEEELAQRLEAFKIEQEAEKIVLGQGSKERAHSIANNQYATIIAAQNSSVSQQLEPNLLV
ncbi:MAG: EF-hand domain-containing protein [Magnetococcales bacterium]|nr:EF-hand domain-containing protein [Magnetococcales bacterium]